MAEDLRRWFEPEAWDELQGALGMMNDDRLLNWWQSRVLSRHSEAARYGTSVVLTRGKDALIASPLLHPSTAHAAKGAEADHVFLFPDLSAAADETWWSGGRLRDPVVRAIYVAITRTREVLHICEPAGRRHVEL